MKISIRITGTKDDIQAFVEALFEKYSVSNISGFYENKGTDNYRVYLEIKEKENER